MSRDCKTNYAANVKKIMPQIITAFFEFSKLISKCIVIIGNSNLFT